VLTPKQAEYLDYVTQNRHALLALTTTSSTSPHRCPAHEARARPVNIEKAIEASRRRHPRPARTDRIPAQGRYRSQYRRLHRRRRRVVQCSIHLLANAVGFSPHDAAVTISARRNEHRVNFHRHRFRPRYSRPM